MSVLIKLDQFEGPLDLLCHLIDKHELDIYDIPIALITEQYLAVIYDLHVLNLELASEFLVMAATLLEIKSRMLLPQSDYGDSESLREDPRIELVGKIVEYRRYKEAALHLQELESQFGQRHFKEPEDLDRLLDRSSDALKALDLETDLLVEALKRVLERMDRIDNHREIYFKTMRRDPHTVEEKMGWITRRLNFASTVRFMSLFEEDTTRLEVITTFLALLELMRGGKVKVRQNVRLEDPEIIAIEQVEYGQDAVSH